MPAYPLPELAQALGGRIWPPESNVPLNGVAPPETARATDLVFLLDPSWLPAIQASTAQVVLLDDKTSPDLLPHKILLRVPHVRQALAQALALFAPPIATPLVLRHPTACIDSTAVLAESVQIGALSYIGAHSNIGPDTHIYPQAYVGHGVTIGQRCCVHSQVVIQDGCTLGDDVVIHSGTVIGADGYGFYQVQGKHYKIPQVGAVTIGDRVEIGANSTVDRGTVGNTVIGSGTKIDNLVQIGHNVQIGEDCLIVAQVGLSGSVKLGQRVTLAGQVGVAGHLSIGDDVVVAGKSGVTQSIASGLKVSGFPAQEHRQEMRLQALLRKLPEMWRMLKGS